MLRFFPMSRPAKQTRQFLDTRVGNTSSSICSAVYIRFPVTLTSDTVRLTPIMDANKKTQTRTRMILCLMPVLLKRPV